MMLCIIVMLPLASALTMVVETSDGTRILTSPTMTVKVNPAANKLLVNNIVSIPMFPTIKSKGATIAVSNPQATTLAPGERVQSYVVSYTENFGGDVFASADVEIKDDYVSHVITIENSGDAEVTVELEVLPTGTGTYYIFAPYKREPNANYLWISPALSNEMGEGMVVSFDNLRPTYDQPQEINAKTGFTRTLSWTIPLAPKEKKSVGMKYRPGYINDEALLTDNKYSASYSKQYILSTQTDALFDITGATAVDTIRPVVSETATASDVLQLFKQTLDTIPDTPTAESTLATTAVSLQSAVTNRDTGLNSVEKSLLFRELCRNTGIPAEVHVGFKDLNYYAWVVAFVGTSGFTYDPAGKASQYVPVYTEPESANCRGDLYKCPWAGGIQTDQFCVGPLCMSAPILIGVFILAFILVFVVFQYKTDVVYKVLGLSTGGAKLVKDELNGTYAIANDAYLPKDPLEQTVWNALRRRAGSFKAEDYVTETGFSEVLVKSAIERFLEKGAIRKTY